MKFRYRTENNQVIITDYVGRNKEVIIPNEIKNPAALATVVLPNPFHVTALGTLRGIGLEGKQQL